jgi:hypothetical protein
MGSASSKTESELPEGNKLNSSSASESIKIEFERIEKNLNKSIHKEFVKAEHDINDLFIAAETKFRKTDQPAEIISVSVGTESTESSTESSPKSVQTISSTSELTKSQAQAAKNLGTMSSSSETSESPKSVKAKSSKRLTGGLTESEIDIQVVPLMNGGAQFSESSPFITSEVFRKTLEQNGGVAESEFDSNKLLNIIMQMGGEDSESESKSESESDSDAKHKTKSEDSEDEDEDSDDDLFEDTDDDEEDDSEKKEEEGHQVARSVRTSSERRHTPKDKDSSSSSEESSSSSELSSSSSSSKSSSDSEKFPTLSPESFGLAVPRRISGLSGLNSSDSASSVYIMSSDSSIGSRDINLLSFDEPAWGKSSGKKSKKAKKY